MIPDGAFRTIPLGKIDRQAGLGTGFTWTPAVRARTNLIIVGGDNRGMGSGGFISNFVNPGDPSRDASGDCPAPMSMPAPSNIIPSPHGVGAIVGSVFGCVVFLGLLIFISFLLRRKGAKPRVLKLSTEKDPAYYGKDMYGTSYAPQQKWMPPAYTGDSSTTSSTSACSGRQGLSWSGSPSQPLATVQ